MILDGKHLTGTVVVNDNLWLADCRVQDATLVVTGDLYIERPSIFETVALAVSGDLVTRPPTLITGNVKAKMLAAHNELTVEGSIVADSVLTMAESVFTTMTTRVATFNGMVRAGDIGADSITIDGDLIADAVSAKSLHGERGSILVKDLKQTLVSAPMIGNYSDQALDCQQFIFRWARPMVLSPRTSSIPDMVENGIAALQHHAPDLPTTHFDRLRAIEQCSDMGDLYAALYADLKAIYPRLTPAAQQFVECVEVHGFPGNYWRF